MDKEYLEDYAQREQAEYNEFMRQMHEGKFNFKKDRFPSDSRFVNLKRPLASSPTMAAARKTNMWAQVPFSGSYLIRLPPVPESIFERSHFATREIPEIISFIKETGRLQVGFNSEIEDYVGLDYLDPFFEELSPPLLSAAPTFILSNEHETKKAMITFHTLGSIRFSNFLKRLYWDYDQRLRSLVWEKLSGTYLTLKLGRYPLAEEVENLIVDKPEDAFDMLETCAKFIDEPLTDVRSDLLNYTFDSYKDAKSLPPVYRPSKMRFPCEIGKFLINKLTYAPLGLDACKELIYHYNAYDLRKVQESLNEAITTNNPDIVDKSAEELSEILDNVWNDKTIPRRIKGLRMGIPISMAVLGSVAAGPIGGCGGFLAGLGYTVADKFIDLGTEGLSERLATLKTKSCQVNIYNFKKRHKNGIVQDSKGKHS